MRDAGRALSVATLIVALSGYAVIVLAGHALSPADYQRFTVYWGLFFACTGILDGLLQETTRAVAAAGGAESTGEPAQDGQRPPARPLSVTGGVSLATAAVVAVTSTLWADRLIPGAGAQGVALLTLGLASYAVQATVCGLLSASGRWRTYGRLISVDSAVRVALAGLAWTAGWQLTAFLLVTVVGAATWTVLCVAAASTRAAQAGALRRVLGAVADIPRGGFLRRTGAAMVASGSNALLVTGFPVLFTVTSPHCPPGALAAVITAVTLTRAPLLVPLQRVMPALIVHFTRHRDRILRAVVRPTGWCVAVSCAGGLLAWWIAVPVASWFFPADLVAPAGTFGLLTLASGSLAVLMVTGAATLTSDSHGSYVAGWVVATLVAVALLHTGHSPDLRAVLALGIAPLVGAAVHLAHLVLRTHPGVLWFSSPGRTSQARTADSSARTR